MWAILATTGSAGAGPGTWTRVLLADAAKKGAVCLDGSPGGYYIRRPLVKTSKEQWVVFHEGGGWCGSDGNCRDRANSSLGSSTFWPEVPPGTLAPGVSYEGAEMFGSETFATATVVYAKYCDGGSWTGNSVATVGTQRVFYRGRRAEPGRPRPRRAPHLADRSVAGCAL